jgi:hypothetical protein
MALDEPQPHSLDVINFMREHGYVITYMTGRNEKHRDVTRSWLEKHGYMNPFHPDQDKLIMRPKHDGGTPASQMKEKMFLDYVARDGLYGNPFFFFEDDRYVLGTWQKYGMVFVCPQAWEFMNPSVLDPNVEPAWNR